MSVWLFCLLFGGLRSACQITRIHFGFHRSSGRGTDALPRDGIDSGVWDCDLITGSPRGPPAKTKNPSTFGVPRDVGVGFFVTYHSADITRPRSAGPLRYRDTSVSRRSRRLADRTIIVVLLSYWSFDLLLGSPMEET